MKECIYSAGGCKEKMGNTAAHRVHGIRMDGGGERGGERGGEGGRMWVIIGINRVE